VKRKFQGLMSIGLMVSAVAIAAAYAASASWKAAGESQVPREVRPPEISVPGPAVMKEISQAGRAMASLAIPPGSDLAPPKLALFGYPKDVFGQAVLSKGIGGNHHIRKRPMDYTVSFAFTSGKKRFCIIDGSFYTEKSDLPQGGKILKIESRRIHINKDGVDKWVTVAGGVDIDVTGKTKRELAHNKNDRDMSRMAQ